MDDFVVRRNDGTPAYQLAVVVDDAAQRIGEVVRGADLVDSTPRQILLSRMLGLPERRYAHVPLVLGPDGQRLAKRHGAVTLSDRGEGPDEVRAWMARSLGLAEDGEMPTTEDLLARFDPDACRASRPSGHPILRSEPRTMVSFLCATAHESLVRGDFVEVSQGFEGLQQRSKSNLERRSSLFAATSTASPSSGSTRRRPPKRSRGPRWPAAGDRDRRRPERHRRHAEG